MAKLVFNNQNPNTKGYGLISYNRNTTRNEDDDTIQCLAYANIECTAATISQLMSDFNSSITRISIYDDEGVLAYDLQNLTAKISSISETWNGTKVDVYININTGANVAPAAPVSGN